MNTAIAITAIIAAVVLANSIVIAVRDVAKAKHQAADGPAEVAIARVRAVCDQLHRASVLADGQPHTDRERGVIQAVSRVVAALDGDTNSKESNG